MRKLFILLVISSCSSPFGCHDKPTPPSFDGKTYVSYVKDGKNVIAFNPDKFSSCSALQVTYDGVFYGFVLPSDLLYTATSGGNVEITCVPP